MASCVKQELSGGPGDGRLIKVAATGTPGTTIHTAGSVTGTDNYDEIWLWAVNTTTVSEKLTIEWGTTSAPDDNIELVLSPENGLITIIPGMILQNSLVVRAFAAQANVVSLGGFVNQIRA